MFCFSRCSIVLVSVVVSFSNTSIFILFSAWSTSVPLTKLKHTSSFSISSFFSRFLFKTVVALLMAGVACDLKMSLFGSRREDGEDGGVVDEADEEVVVCVVVDAEVI